MSNRPYSPDFPLSVTQFFFQLSRIFQSVMLSPTPIHQLVTKLYSINLKRTRREHSQYHKIFHWLRLISKKIRIKLSFELRSVVVLKYLKEYKMNKLHIAKQLMGWARSTYLYWNSNPSIPIINWARPYNKSPVRPFWTYTKKKTMERTFFSTHNTWISLEWKCILDMHGGISSLYLKSVNKCFVFEIKNKEPSRTFNKRA